MRNTALVVAALIMIAPRAKADIVTGAGAGGGPHVKRFDGGGAETASFFAYAPNFTGGVRVATGDVNGDGVADIITGAASAASHVKAFDGVTLSEATSFLAYPPGVDGVSVATGKGLAGAPKIITGARAGSGPHVKAFNGGGSETHSFFAYVPGVGGVEVAAGDTTGDGVADIVTAAGAGGGPHVKVFDGNTGAEILSFFASGRGLGGVNVAAGDLNGDGLAELVTGTTDGGTVSIFNGQTGDFLLSLFPFGPSFSGGLNVAIGDATSQGRNDIVVSAGPGGGPQVKVFDGRTYDLLRTFAPYGLNYTGEISVAAPQAVPEPTTIALLAFGSLAPLTNRRRNLR